MGMVDRLRINNAKIYFIKYSILAFEQSLLTDAYWDSLQESVTPQKIKNLFNIQSFYFGVIERLRLSILKIKYVLWPPID